MFRKAKECIEKVDLAIMKLQNTLENVKKALVYQSDDMNQRADELNMVSEENFRKVNYQSRKSISEIFVRDVSGFGNWSFDATSSMENSHFRPFQGGGGKIRRPSLPHF
jgi:hypothetical protein